MARDVNVIVHFRDVERTEELHEAIDRRCRHLADEFPETVQFEVSLAPDSNEIGAHAKVTGKNTSVAAHASAPDERRAADAALDRLERELRSAHDKRIFTPRREARKAKAERRS